MSPTASLATQLTDFAASRLNHVRPAQITRVTAHLILACAFFSGALLRLAREREAGKGEYLPVLTRFLSLTFGLGDEHAAGLVESNARMYKRYVLVERVYQLGWTAAEDWLRGDAAAGTELRDVLATHPELSMATLGVEGTKEAAPAAPARETPRATTPAAEPPPRRPLLVWLLGLLALAGLTALAWFFLG